MLKNKSFLVKMVDEPKSDTPKSSTLIAPFDPANIAEIVGEQMIVGAMACIATYVTADTLRQVIVLSTKAIIK